MRARVRGEQPRQTSPDGALVLDPGLVAPKLEGWGAALTAGPLGAHLESAPPTGSRAAAGVRKGAPTHTGNSGGARVD